MFFHEWVLLLETAVYYECPKATWVSLIAGLEYGMEWWNGKWNGMANIATV